MTFTRRVAAAALSVLLLMASSCSAATGDGSATEVSAPESPATGPSTPNAIPEPTTSTPGDQPDDGAGDVCESDDLGDVEKAAEGCPGYEDVPPDDEEPTATFKDAYTTPDGVEVEVVKVAHGKTRRQDVSGGQKAGRDYVILTTRVKNGSTQKIKVHTTTALTYGTDGEAKPAVLADLHPQLMRGVIRPGRSKTQRDLFLIPRRHQKDAVFEFGFDMDHDAAVFSGPLE